MTTALLIIGALVAVGLSALFSGAETGVYCLDRVRLGVRSDRKDPRAQRLARLMDRREDLVITTLLGTNVADYLVTVCVTVLLMRAAVSDALSEIYATAIVTPIILVLGGVIPKDWFRRQSDRLMYPLASPLKWFRQVAAWMGVVWLLRTLAHGLVRRLDPQRAIGEADLLPRARMQRLLREGAVRGGLTAFQRDTIERVMKISRVRVADVMVPRLRAANVRRDISRDDLLRIARMAHFSRLPVYHDDPRRVVGIVNVYHILTDEEQRPIAEHVQPATCVNADESVPAALLKLQQARQVMGIVVDTAGHYLGLFTIKDLVEEIVGELEAW